MKTEMNTVKVRKTEELEAEQLGAHIGEIVESDEKVSLC